MSGIEEKIGYLIAKVEGIAVDIADIKDDISENVKPVISDYKRDRNFIIGVCATVSAVVGAAFGGVGKTIMKVFGGE